MKQFWAFSFDLSNSYTALISELTSDTENATKVSLFSVNAEYRINNLKSKRKIQQLEQKQALARQLADLLHFTLKFDKRKMENAQLQNDYSFFRCVCVCILINFLNSIRVVQPIIYLVQQNQYCHISQ